MNSAYRVFQNECQNECLYAGDLDITQLESTTWHIYKKQIAQSKYIACSSICTNVQINI